MLVYVDSLFVQALEAPAPCNATEHSGRALSGTEGVIGGPQQLSNFAVSVSMVRARGGVCV